MKTFCMRIREWILVGGFFAVTLNAQDVTTTTDGNTVVLPFSGSSQVHQFDLSEIFTLDGLGDGTLVRFISNQGVFHIELLEEEAPITTENFLNYVNSGRYNNSIIHRSVSNNPNFPDNFDFVIQGGGFSLEAGDEAPQPIETDPPIVNEFNPENSNLRGTLSMAKLGGDPDSATSQFFVNLDDNSDILDDQNGGFTVFARVLGQGMTVIDEWADIAAWNASSAFGGAFEEIPLPDFDNTSALTLDNFIIFLDVRVIERIGTEDDPGLLEVELQSVSEDTLADFTLEESILTVTTNPGAIGEVDATFRVNETAFSESNFLEQTFTFQLGGLAPDREFENGWKVSRWFGLYYEADSGWIFHPKLDWLFLASSGSNGGSFLHTPIGWVWTRADVFPHMWRFGSEENPEGNWIYWDRTSEDPPYFFDFSLNSGEGGWTTYED